MHGAATLSMLTLVARNPAIPAGLRAGASLLVFKIDQVYWRLNLLPLGLPIFEHLFAGVARETIFERVMTGQAPRTVH